MITLSKSPLELLGGRVGTLVASPAAVLRVLGTPTIDDGYDPSRKTEREWHFRVNGRTVTIYAYRERGGDAFWHSQESFDFSIAGTRAEDAEAVVEWFNAKLVEVTP